MNNKDAPENFDHGGQFIVAKEVRSIFLRALCRHINLMPCLDDKVLIKQLGGGTRTRQRAINKIRKVSKNETEN